MSSLKPDSGPVAESNSAKKGKKGKNGSMARWLDGSKRQGGVELSNPSHAVMTEDIENPISSTLSLRERTKDG